nr:hypothetical protein B0A51_08014 [Rachicladosporium sp. CCFEE 5018]
MASVIPHRRAATYICASCRHRLTPPHPSRRTFSTNPPSFAEDSSIASLFNPAQRTQSSTNKRRGFSPPSASNTRPAPSSLIAAIDGPSSVAQAQILEESRNLGTRDDQPHRLHVLATKHNTHLTFVQPPRPASQTASSGISATNSSATDQKKVVDVLLSLSAGNIGFRKAGRGSYDAAYQLTAFVLKQIQEKGMLRDMSKLEVVMRGFGAGREAVTKVLLGSEGRGVRDRISAVKDATRLKIGGTRRPLQDGINGLVLVTWGGRGFDHG